MTDSIHILSATAISASYNSKPVLSEATLAIHSGEVVCLTGQNGSGKSTLLSLMAGIIPEGLTITHADEPPSFDGRNILSFSRKQTARHIAYMTQYEQSSWNYSAEEIIRMGRYAHTMYGIYTAHDNMITEQIITNMHIELLAARKIFSLSGGEAQKIRIARALAQEPDFILLDEPVANLDFGYQTELLSLVTRLAHNDGLGVLISIHDLNTAARFADRMILLPKNSRCISGNPHTVLTPENLKTTYGMKFGIFSHPVYHIPQVYTL